MPAGCDAASSQARARSANSPPRSRHGPVLHERVSVWAPGYRRRPGGASTRGAPRCAACWAPSRTPMRTAVRSSGAVDLRWPANGRARMAIVLSGISSGEGDVKARSIRLFSVGLETSRCRSSTDRTRPRGPLGDLRLVDSEIGADPRRGPARSYLSALFMTPRALAGAARRPAGATARGGPLHLERVETEPIRAPHFRNACAAGDGSHEFDGLHGRELWPLGRPSRCGGGVLLPQAARATAPRSCGAVAAR